MIRIHANFVSIKLLNEFAEKFDLILTDAGANYGYYASSNDSPYPEFVFEFK